MQADLFYLQLNNFVKRHGISASLPSRLKKLQEEVDELAEAIALKDNQAIVKEAADVAIIASHIMIICGAIPLWAMYLKLCEVAERPKYKEMARRRATNYLTLTRGKGK